MTRLHLYLRARATTDVPWDSARERRALDRALDARRGRARRRLGFELAAAMVVTFLVGRVLPRASVESDEARPLLAVPASKLDAKPDGDLAIPRSESAAKQTKSRSLGGFAGTGGHGGTGSTGHGGSAGTG